MLGNYRMGLLNAQTTTTGSRSYAEQLIKYRMGIVLQRLHDNDEAKALYEEIKDDCAYGYIGLASLQDDIGTKIQYLIQAVEHGAAEGWLELGRYVDHPELHRQWSVENIALIRHTATPHTGICDYHAQPTACVLCQKEQSYKLQEGVNRTDYQIPSSHIDSDLFTPSSNGQDDSTIIPIENCGGQGMVRLYKLRTKSHSIIDVALKRPSNVNGIVNDNYLDRELRHLQLFAQCDYIVQCYGHTHISNDHYIVMEASQYGDLTHVMSDVRLYIESSNGLGLLVKWMYDIAKGLAHMHRLFVRHDDIKPDNILVFDNLHVKLADFGYSKKSIDIFTTGISPQRDHEVNMNTNSDTQASSLTRTLTGTSSMYGGGTYGYQPPELLCNERLTFQSDIFSYGATWLHVINNKKNGYAFKQALEEAKRRCIQYYQDTRYNEVNEFVVLLERCLAIERSDRPTADECVEVLERLLSTSWNDEELNKVVAMVNKRY